MQQQVCFPPSPLSVQQSLFCLDGVKELMMQKLNRNREQNQLGVAVFMSSPSSVPAVSERASRRDKVL